MSPPRIPDSNDPISKVEQSNLVKSEDNKESLRPLLLPKSRDVNLDDEIKTKKIIGAKRRKGIQKEIEKAKNQSKKNYTPQVNGEFFLQEFLSEKSDGNRTIDDVLSFFSARLSSTSDFLPLHHHHTIRKSSKMDGAKYIPNFAFK